MIRADKMTDAEYLRDMKRSGFPSACKEQLEHNNRLEAIAEKIERLDILNSEANKWRKLYDSYT